MSAHYVYRVYDHDDRLIYVGCTVNLIQRLRAHYYGCTSWWSDQAQKTVAKVYRTRREGRAAESSAIRSERPRWNITGKWCTNADWSDDDFLDFVTALLNSSEFSHGTLRRAHRVDDTYFKRTGRRLNVDWESAEQYLLDRQSA